MTDPKGGQPGAWPRITVITPVRNAADYIAEAIESAARQGYPDLEHIVLDARSTDGTLEILARFPGLRVVSAPDRGPHDAMNKGIGLASGEIIGFLNADDLYTDGLLREAGRIFAEEPEAEMVVARTVVFADDGRGGRRILAARDHETAEGLWLPELAFGAPGFNGRFFRRRVFERIGNFNNDYYIGADRHFLLRALLAGVKPRHVRGAFGLCYRSHAGSATMNPELRQVREIGREHVRMADEFLRASGAGPEQRRVFRAWRAFESAKLVFRGVAAGQPGEAACVLAQLVRREPLWPLWLARGFALRRAVRQDESRSQGLALPAEGK